MGWSHSHNYLSYKSKPHISLTKSNAIWSLKWLETKVNLFYSIWLHFLCSYSLWKKTSLKITLLDAYLLAIVLKQKDIIFMILLLINLLLVMTLYLMRKVPKIGINKNSVQNFFTADDEDSYTLIVSSKNHHDYPISNSSSSSSPSSSSYDSPPRKRGSLREIYQRSE